MTGAIKAFCVYTENVVYRLHAKSAVDALYDLCVAIGRPFVISGGVFECRGYWKAYGAGTITKPWIIAEDAA